MLFGFGDGIVLIDQRGEETIIGFGVLSGENRVAFAREGVRGAVARDAGLAFGRAGASGELGVAAIGFDAAGGGSGGHDAHIVVVAVWAAA